MGHPRNEPGPAPLPFAPTTADEGPQASGVTPAFSPFQATTPVTGPALRSNPLDETLTLDGEQGPSPPLPDGSIAGIDDGRRYAARGLIGSGGMGEVQLFADLVLGREVAVKRLRDELTGSATALRRFVREARVQGQIEHPAVVPVHDLGVTPDGNTYFTMRRIRGRTLQEVLAQLASGDAEARARYSRRKLLTAFASVCLAVHYAHTRGVVHRDLKPGNVMLGDFGEVYVLDWGLAKVRGQGADAGGGDGGGGDGGGGDEPVVVGDLAPGPGQHTAVGALMGTPDYMSPEQARGQVDEIDARSDVYALGVILFEILTLERLHRGETVPAILAATLEGKLDRPSRRDPGVPPELDAICARALSPRPDDRFATARELSDAIERYLDGDRDLEQRRRLAEGHAARADEAAARAERGGSPEASQAARREAMNELMSALALDPEHAHARATLARIIVEAPDALPPEAAAKMAQSAARARREALRTGWLIYVSWIGCVLYTMYMGVRSFPPFLLATASVLACIAVSGALVVRGSSSTATLYAVAGVTFTAIATFSCWLGPFVMVPLATSCGALLFAVQAEPRERRVVIGMAVLSALVPYLIDFSGLVPPGFVFQEGQIVLPARAVFITPGKTLAGLIYMSVAFTAAPAWYIGRVQDKLRGAERRLFLQAWHLEQLARGDKPPTERQG